MRSVGIHTLVLERLVSRVVRAMEFSLDNPGFSTSADVAPGALQDSSAPSLPPTTSGSASSAPLLGETACRSCPKCHRRMSITPFDHHTCML